MCGGVQADREEQAEASNALLEVMTTLLETGLDVVSSSDRHARLEELAALCADLDRFSQAVLRLRPPQAPGPA